MTRQHGHSTPSPLTTGDIVILTIVVTVLLTVTILGGGVLWNELNPSAWTAGGWAAVGAWVSGAATFVAVLVALRQSRRARADSNTALAEARHHHQERLRYEIWRSDLEKTVKLLAPLTDLRSVMFSVDAAIDSYNGMNADFAAGLYPEPDEDPNDGPTVWELHATAISGHLASVKEAYIAARSVGIAVRSPDLRTAVEHSGNIIELIGDQIHIWSTQAGNMELEPELDSIRQMALETSTGVGVLPTLAAQAERVIRHAVQQSDIVDLWLEEHHHTPAQSSPVSGTDPSR